MATAGSSTERSSSPRERMEPRLEDSEDKRLMAELAAGNDLALNQIMRRWQRPVRAFLLRYLANDADLDDLVQETFVRVFKHRARYEPKSRFSTWLFTIAVNLSRNHAEKMGRRAAEPLDAPRADDSAQAPAAPREHASPDTGPAEQALARERAEAVRAAIQELPADLRSAVILFEYQELSHAEIAEIAGTTPKAIETRLYRARGALRDKLARWLKS